MAMASAHAYTRGEGAGLVGPAAAAKEEQLAQHENTNIAERPPASPRVPAC
jgi:hypothetical protein